MSASPAVHEAVHRTDQRFDQLLGELLRIGVGLAALIVLTGGVLYVSRHPAPPTGYHTFHGQPPELRSISGIIQEARSFSGRGLIQLGLLILIATPIARVAFSVFAFLYQRDWTYVLVTLLVLALLFYSLLGGHA